MQKLKIVHHDADVDPHTGKDLDDHAQDDGT